MCGTKIIPEINLPTAVHAHVTIVLGLVALGGAVRFHRVGVYYLVLLFKL